MFSLICLCFAWTVFCVTTVNSSTATFHGYCDDGGYLERSDDGGATYTQIASNSEWSTPYAETLTNVESSTRLRFSCTAGTSGANAFIGQVTYEGAKFFTTDPLSSKNWVETTGNAASFWPQHMFNVDYGSIDSAASWVQILPGTTAVFEFDFAQLGTESAEFVAYCDDGGYLERSDDGGANYFEVASNTLWSDQYDLVLGAISRTNTKLRFYCTAGASGKNMFIGQITFDGILYFTREPLDSGNWQETTGNVPTFWDQSVYPEISFSDFSSYAKMAMVDAGQTAIFEFDFATTAASNVLGKGERMYEGDYLMSENGLFKAIMQTDGNFVVYSYTNGVAETWSTGTAGVGSAPYRIQVQNDNNFVLYDATSGRWSTSTHTVTADDMNVIMQNDGNLVNISA